jgi:hypothetical protein
LHQPFLHFPYDATLANDIGTGDGWPIGSICVPECYTQDITDQFGSTATGTVIGVTVTQNLGFIGFEEIVNTALSASAATTTARPVSTLLAKSGKVSDKALRRLRALERAQKAAIAARAK